jgi:hypothetical protein
MAISVMDKADQIKSAKLADAEGEERDRHRRARSVPTLAGLRWDIKQFLFAVIP